MAVPDLDPRAILAALGMRDVTAMVPVRGGQDTALWRVESGGEPSALRVFRVGQAARCRREQLAMAAAAAGGIPVPAVRADGVWRERQALVLSWCPGRPVAQALRSHPWRAWSLGVGAGQLLAALHRIPAPTLPGRAAASWITWAGPDRPALQALLRERAAPVEALLHLDYHPHNVLTDGYRITAVLDWANAAAGDPRADLARTITILRLDSASAAVPQWFMASVMRAYEAGLRHGYERVARPIGADLAPFYAWAGAVMERDLAGRLGPGQQARIRRWTQHWAQRAGCAE